MNRTAFLLGTLFGLASASAVALVAPGLFNAALVPATPARGSIPVFVKAPATPWMKKPLPPDAQGKEFNGQKFYVLPLGNLNVIR